MAQSQELGHWEAPTGLSLPSTFTMPLHGGKEPPLWSGESETFQPIREQIGVLQPQMQEEDLLTHLPHFRAGRKVEKGEGTSPSSNS